MESASREAVLCVHIEGRIPRNRLKSACGSVAQSRGAHTFATRALAPYKSREALEVATWPLFRFFLEVTAYLYNK